jgi:adenosylhomocysteine nucleosidase
MGAGVVAALAAEARTLGSAARNDAGRAVLADGTLVAVSGIGCTAAARAAIELIEAGATALASWGLAGALDPRLEAGAVCLPSEVTASDGKSFMTARHWREPLAALIAAAQRPVVCGKLLTSARAIDTVAAKQAAHRKTGAAAVDMESFAVAQVAAAHRLPFIAVRVIVDTAGDVVPRCVVAASEAGRLQVWRLMRGLLRSPADIVLLVRLARRYRVAMRSLSGVARLGMLAPPAAGAVA